MQNFSIGIIVFLTSFYTYLHTLCPSVYVGDSGELITAAYTLGICHPPGYPVYCILGKIATIIFPYGNIAFRVNLVSVFLHPQVSLYSII